MRMAHSAFQISRFRPYHGAESTESNLDIFIDTDGMTEPKVETSFGRTEQKSRVRYLVLFKGDSKYEAMHISKADLKNCRRIILERETCE